MNPFSWIESLISRIASVYKPVAEGEKKPWLKRILVPIALLLLLGVVVFLALAILPQLPMRFWQVLALCMIALVVIWWLARGQKQMAIKGRTRKRIGDLGPGNEDDEREPLARMGAAIDEAKRTISRSPDIDKGRDPLYRIPWVLMIGDEMADVDALLRAAAEVSPFPAPDAAQLPADDVWRWWFHKSMIAIQMHPRVVCDSSARLDRGLWYQALMKLASGREKLPLNGIVVAISVQTLLGPADELKEVATRLRRLVDEAMEHLQVSMPVYFVVSGLERLPGYAQIHATLPAEAFTQVLGYRMDDGKAISAASSGLLEDIVEPINERLHALRMTALRAKATPAERLAIFDFIHALHQAKSGLSLFVNLLLEDNPFQRTPRWRGLYFAAGQNAAHRGGAFVADLFTRFLPSDQPLASPSFRGNASRMGLASLGVLAMLGLSAALAYGLSAARKDDSHLLAQTRSACADVTERTSTRRITTIASCGRTIQQLEAAASGTLLGFGIRRADRDIEGLKKRVTEDFANLILAPYDQMLTTDIQEKRAGMDHLLALAQRIRLLENCRKDRDFCRERELPNNVSFDAASRLFAPFVTPDNNTTSDRDNAMALFSTYLGYLRWQKKTVLDAEQERLESLLEKLLAQYNPSSADFRKWADERNPGMGLERFWLPDGRVVGQDAGEVSNISNAYTLDTWEGVMAPLLTTLESGAFKVDAERINTFRDGYFSDYFRNWASFLASFQSGIGLWRGHYDELRVRAAGHENPYQFFFRSMERNLYELPLDWPVGARWSSAWSQMKASWLSSWRPFGRFVGDFFRFGQQKVEPPAWLLAVRKTRDTVLPGQEVTFARAYLRLANQGSSEEVYQIAADIFASKGRAEQPPASDYTELLSAVDKPPEAYAARFKGDDLSAWSVVQGPSRLLLFLTVQRAGEHVQQRWKEGVVQPLSNLPPGEQVAALYGDKGRLAAFVNDWLKPFISEKERTALKVAGVAMPLSASYQSMLASEQKLLPVLDNAQPFPAGTFTFSRPSDLGALDEGDSGTVLEIDCRERVYRASSAGHSLADASTQVFWSPATCLEARIRVELSIPVETPKGDAVNEFDPESGAMQQLPPQSLTLTRMYSGEEGFAELIRHFSDGSHSFAIEDFRASYSPQQWSQLVPQLTQARFRNARVFLAVEPSDEMKRYLGARTLPAELPASILE